MTTQPGFIVHGDGSTTPAAPDHEMERERYDPELVAAQEALDLLSAYPWQAQCRIVRFLYSKIVKGDPTLDAA